MAAGSVSTMLRHCGGRLVKPRIVKTFSFILVLWVIAIFIFVISNNTSLCLPADLSLNRNEAFLLRPNAGHGLGGVSVQSNGSSVDDVNNTNAYNSDVFNPDQENATDSVEKCQYPVLDPFDPSVIALTKFNPPLNCEKGVPHLVYMSGYTIKVNHSRTALYANTTHPFKECWYKSVAKEAGTDFKTVVVYTSEWFQDELTPREIDDNLVVECFNTNNTVISRSYFTLIRIKTNLELELEEKYKKHMTLNSPKEVLNVLMIGLDGNSKQNLERHMPKTRNFLLNELKALELHRYNKVDDHTYPNVCALTSGKTWQELERDNWTWRDHFDFMNDEFLWSEFRKVGYRTGIVFDENLDTPFHFMKKGWDKPPVDYYMRATVIDRCNDQLMKNNGFHCIGDIPEVTYYSDFWIKMASTFNSYKTKPYFGFSFFSHLTHDDHNLASAGDHLYLQFFQELRDKNLINNTVILFFSDHGERFGNVRFTYNGMLESKMPHIFLIFPPWFHQKYPELMKVLKINQERLTTNKDVHATLLDLVNFQATTGKGDVNKKGISLFKVIPRERTCEHADISMEYCLCHQLTTENISTSMNLLLSEGIKWRLWELTNKYRDKCEELKYWYTKDLRKIQPDDALTEEEKKDIVMYQMTITTWPGKAIYEATVKFRHSTKKVEVVGNIMRLNMYRGQVECIDDTDVRPYCFCKK